MNPAIAQAILFLVPVLGRVATELLEALLVRLQHAVDEGTLDDQLLATSTQIVRGIGLAHPEWSAEEKQRTAAAAIRQAGSDEGRSLPAALVNQLIELAVERIKYE